VEREDNAASELFARAGWADWSEEPTCLTANSTRSRRKDQVLISSEMQTRLQEVHVDWAVGLKTHALQQGLFRSGEPDRFMSWNLGDPGPPEEEPGFQDEEFEQLFAGSRAAWSQACSQQDVDGMWQLLEPVLCQCHSARSPEFTQPAAQTTSKAEEPRRSWHQGDMASQRLTAATRRKRRLQQWLSSVGRPECAKQLCGIRRAVAADPDPEWTGIAMLGLPKEAVEQLVATAREDEDRIRAELREQRRQGFQSWCKAESEGGMRTLFRWVRDGPKGMQSTGILTKGEQLFVGQKALLAACELAWWPLWQQPQGPRWERVVPPRPAPGWEVKPLEAEQLQRLIQVMAKGKAPGHDGWTVGRMRQWPLAAWSCIAQLFRAVETAGRWPAALRGGVICLLPKGGAQVTTKDPLEARPVVLLPLLYRLWAYKRGPEMGAWLKKHGVEGLPEGAWSAEAYGSMLTAELERALVLDEPLLAVCIDLSKAYDTVRLDLLEHLYSNSGLPTEVWRPMLDMAKAPRRLKVMQAVGEWGEPTSGIPPGCPAATFVMSFLLERWRRFTAAAGPTTRVRCWVDDSTAEARGSTEGLATLVAATRAMEDLEQGDGSRVNRKKSGVLASHKALRRLVEEATVARSGSPYGLVAGFGPEEPAGWQQLWRQRLQAQEATTFEWHGAGREHPEEDVRAVAAATTVWLAFDGQAPPLEAETVLRANRGVWLDARLPQSADGKLVAEQSLQMHPGAMPPRADAGGAGPLALATGAQERRRFKVQAGSKAARAHH
jgi:hypothetical protein